MATIDEIKNRIRSENPTLNKAVNHDVFQLTPEEYEATINSWAEAEYKQQEEERIRTNGGVTPNYAQFRREAYPSLPDQLDMIYHDSVDGTTTWNDAIAAVKAKYRKP
jgi:hypothetical protein